MKFCVRPSAAALAVFGDEGLHLIGVGEARCGLLGLDLGLGRVANLLQSVDLVTVGRDLSRDLVLDVSKDCGVVGESHRSESARGERFRNGSLGDLLDVSKINRVVGDNHIRTAIAAGAFRDRRLSVELGGADDVGVGRDAFEGPTAEFGSFARNEFLSGLAPHAGRNEDVLGRRRSNARGLIFNLSSI